jgi:DNA-binding transcriptional regulator PaaX
MGRYSVDRAQFRALKEVADLIVISGAKFIAKSLAVRTDVSRHTQWRRRKSLEELNKDGYIILSGDKIEISDKGYKALENIWDFKIENTEWDGIWRVIAYDIPEIYRNERDQLRKKLKEVGFKKIQNSLWVHPYECREEISLFANELGITNYVAIMYTDHIPNQRKYKNTFGL